MLMMRKKTMATRSNISVKVGDELDFDNNFYILKIEGGATFIASYKDKKGYIWGLSGDDEDDIYTYINQDDIKKIIASIPKQ